MKKETDLTPIETDIAYMLARGHEAIDICVQIGITYKDYVKNKNKILKKLGIRRITQILCKLT